MMMGEDQKMAFLELVDIRKSFNQLAVVKQFDLSVAKGEFVSFLGPSGCGKTTTLRMVAGFENPTSGSIRIDGKDVTSIRPNQRNVGMVFQSYALFPNMSVAENVAFGLKIAKWPMSEIKNRVQEMLAMIKLPQLAERYPFQLSGGQQQRVALARAIAVKPQVLLLDEPLSALDAKIRISLREEIRALQRQLGITTIYVTHDQEEALSMSDRIVVMNEGRVEQVGTPFEIYNKPATRFVASFVGTLSIMQAAIMDGPSGILSVADQKISLGRSLTPSANGNCTIALRPEAITLTTDGQASMASSQNTLSGNIEDVHFLGSVIRIRMRFKDTIISLDTFNRPGTLPPQPGAKASINFAPSDILVLSD